LFAEVADIFNLIRTILFDTCRGDLSPNSV